MSRDGDTIEVIERRYETETRDGGIFPSYTPKWDVVADDLQSIRAMVGHTTIGEEIVFVPFLEALAAMASARAEKK